MSAGSALAERAREQTCDMIAGLSYLGPGPLLVLLSGLGNDMRSWSPTLIEALNRSAEVLIYDRPGYDLSAALPPSQ
jgi:pimeloyl-ACP methyl ester carboxylesterase